MKFSLWPFRRKKALKDNPEPTVQLQPETEAPEAEPEAIVGAELGKIGAPEALPILGQAGGWNKMRIGQSDRPAGIVPIEDRLEVSDSNGIFRPLIEPAEFTHHLAGLSSFNISEILSRKNDAPGFPEELPLLGEGLTELLAQPGSLPGQLAGLTGAAPVLSVQQPVIRRKVLEQPVDDPEQPSQLEKNGQERTGLPDLPIQNNPQRIEAANPPVSLPLINPQLSDLVSLHNNFEPGIGIISPVNNMISLRSAESILPRSADLPITGNPAPFGSILINSLAPPAPSASSVVEPQSENPEIINIPINDLAQAPAMPTITGSIQMEKQDSQTTSEDVFTAFEPPSQIENPDISTTVVPSNPLPSESEPADFVFLDGGPILSGKEQNKPSSIEMKVDKPENPSTRSGANPSAALNRPDLIRETAAAKPFQINSQPFQLASTVQNLILRQSRPADEMMMSSPTIQLESEAEQTAFPASATSNFVSLDRSGFNSINDVDRQEDGLVQLEEETAGRTFDQESSLRQVQSAEEPRFSSEGLVRRNAPIQKIDRMGPFVSRIAGPGQKPEMSRLEDRPRNLVGGLIQEMQTDGSEEMPLLSPELKPTEATRLGGGLPQMPLPPTLGATLASMNKPVSGSIGQEPSGMSENSKSNFEQAEIPQMPSIDRLTDLIWQQIQRRLQIERERTRGMA